MLKATVFKSYSTYKFKFENILGSYRTIYTVTKIIPLSNLLEPNIMDLPLWLDLSPNILDSSINLWVKDMMS